ncbi:MAG: CoA-binding protein [Chloroflexi bacterium]|nr:CoA-binding protein [Chloroflexota bacterium]
MPGQDLDRLFSPRAVAVVGASTNVDSPGHDYVRALREFGFEGEVYPINPRADEVAGYRAYPSLGEVPGDVDLVICCIPATGVPDVVEACGEAGIPFLHLFTGRLSETGGTDATALEEEIEGRAKARGVRLLGPNGLGIYHPAGRIAFRPDLPRVGGGVAFLSQSGNNAVEVVIRGVARGLRFGKVANYGNGLDLTPGELLAWLADDPETAVIGAYVEGVADGRGFYEGLRRAAARKPVVIQKAGRSAEGAGAAASHTAALAGQAAIWSGMLRQAGAIEAHSQEQLLDLMVGASLLERPGGRRVAVAGGGGGRSVQSADACAAQELALPPLPADVRERVAERAPTLADWVRNPVDQSILAGSGLSANGLLAMMAGSGAYDAGIANVGEEWFLGRPEAEGRLRHACTRLREAIEASPIPVAVVLGATEMTVGWQRELIDSVREELIEMGLAVFPTVERAALALGRLAPR